MKKLGLLLLFILIISNITLYGQEKPKTLFDYPVVPDTISTLENRSNYLLSHFWDKCDLSKPIQDDKALEEAFKDYAVFFQYAHRNVVFTSINNLMNNAQSNKKNFLLLAEIAQRNLYDVGAEVWSDEAYLPFAEFVVKSNKLKSIEKERYRIQIKKINSNKMGMIAPMFDYIDVNGSKKSLSGVEAETLLLFFNDPDCEDCVISRLRLSTNVAINNLIKDGKLKIVSIYPGAYTKEWASKAKDYADNWEIGAYESADEVYDIRVLPNIYILDKDKKILMKNVNVNDFIERIGR